MLIYMVVAQYENGYRDERAFAYHRAARAYAAAHGRNADTVILEVPVVGNLEKSDIAYTIRWDDLTEDTDNVEAVYGNDVQARFAVDRHGRVEKLHIDVSTNARAAILALPNRLARNISDCRYAKVGMRQNRAQRMRRLGVA